MIDCGNDALSRFYMSTLRNALRAMRLPAERSRKAAIAALQDAGVVALRVTRQSIHHDFEYECVDADAEGRIVSGKFKFAGE